VDEEEKYPRALTQRDKEWLFYLLPQDRSGYAVYREKIDSMVVIGEGRFGPGNYVLGQRGDEPDLSYSSLPMFASGQIICKECAIQISIHELYDNKIEISINNISGDEIPDNLTETGRWSYSYWALGKESPFLDDKLREVNLSSQKGRAVLAISPAGQRIWLYDDNTKLNYIIPVTNFLNELLRGNSEIDRTKGVNIDYIFKNLDLFKDEDVVKAFVQYNKQYKKIDLPDKEIAKPKKSILGKWLG
jgi:hypothetical protein